MVSLLAIAAPRDDSKADRGKIPASIAPAGHARGRIRKCVRKRRLATPTRGVCGSVRAYVLQGCARRRPQDRERSPGPRRNPRRPGAPAMEPALTECGAGSIISWN